MLSNGIDVDECVSELIAHDFTCRRTKSDHDPRRNRERKKLHRGAAR